VSPTAGGPGEPLSNERRKSIFRLTVPTCEVWASIGEPKSGRSGASACERNEARRAPGFQARSAGRLLREVPPLIGRRPGRPATQPFSRHFFNSSYSRRRLPRRCLRPSSNAPLGAFLPVALFSGALNHAVLYSYFPNNNPIYSSFFAQILFFAERARTARDHVLS